MGDAHPTGHLVTTVEPKVEGHDVHFGPIVVRVLNYEGGEDDHIVVAIGADQPGDYRVVFEGEISNVTKSTPTGEVVEGYLHYSGEWPSS